MSASYVRMSDLSSDVCSADRVDDGHVLLVEQYRVPLGRNCIELPAGLVGDEDENESVESSAARELEEETGYRAGSVEVLGEFASRSEEHTSELQSLMRISYAVFCLQKKKNQTIKQEKQYTCIITR